MINQVITIYCVCDEFSLTPGSCSDIKAFKNMDLELPKGVSVHGVTLGTATASRATPQK